jgi:hypothetical protein
VFSSTCHPEETAHSLANGLAESKDPWWLNVRVLNGTDGSVPG